MSVKAFEIIKKLQKLAPESLAESWDNVGLLVGSLKKDVSKVLLTLDVTPEVVEEALNLKVELIVSHHPLIFKPLKNLQTDNPQGKMLKELLSNNIAVYSLHTNLDSTTNGVNDQLAKKLNLKNIEVLSPNSSEKLYKLVVFVPKEYTAVVRDALGNKGAGFIGAYSHCTFRASGIGTFKPLEGTNPFIGEQGKIEEVEEDRLETIVPESILDEVVQGMLMAHPYEEVAYDIYPLKIEGQKFGLGRLGYLKEEISLKNFISKVKETLGVDTVKVVGDLNKSIQKVAVCGGSGGSLIKHAYRKKADVFVTGDVSYHDGQLAKDLGIAVIDAGHFATEFPVVDFLKDYLNDAFETNEVQFVVSKVKTEPFNFM